MQSLRYLYWSAGLLGLALVTNGCGGRAVNKKLARDVIVGSQNDALTKGDVQVLSVAQMGPREAIVETQLHSAFRLEKVGHDWVVREVRVGKGQWEKLDDILSSLQQVKIAATHQFLEKIWAAIEAYRKKNGRLPDFNDYVGLSDALYPLFLSPLIREDAWGHPLVAIRSNSGTLRLISPGPDGRLGTPDDIELIKNPPLVYLSR